MHKFIYPLMTTNWGAAQYSQSPYTTGAGVQKSGLVKLWHYRRTFQGSNLFPVEDRSLSIPFNGINFDIPWCSEKSPEFHRRTNNGIPGIVIVPRPNNVLKVRINMQGYLLANYDSSGPDPAPSTNPGFRISLAPEIETAAHRAKTAQARFAENLWAPIRDPAVSTIPTYSVPFSVDASWIIPLNEAPQKYPDVFSMPASVKNHYHLVMAFDVRAVAQGIPIMTDQRVLIKDFESCVEQYQNVEVNYEEVVV